MSVALAEAGAQTSERLEYPVNGNFEAFLLRIQSPSLQDVAKLWHEARGDRRMPSWTDVAPSIAPSYSRMLWRYSYDSGTGEFTGRLPAARFSQWIGGDFDGKRLKDLMPPASYPDAYRFLTRLVTAPVAVRTSGRLFTTGDLAVTGERIALPMAADGKSVDGVLGASDYVPPPLLGSFELIHENIEWYAI